MRNFLVLISVCCSLSAMAGQVNSTVADAPLDYVFQSGTHGCHTYRIPAIVKSKAGTLIAFAEGRVNSSADHGNMDIVASRSTNGGKTWSPLFVVQTDGDYQCGNPAPVVDLKTGRIYLLSCGAESSEGEVMDGKATREVYSQYSDDDGKTWSARENISTQVRLPDWRWYATGPGAGIQILEGKYKGRLVIPANHSDSKKVYYAHCFYSDDHGKTWSLGSTAGKGSNESKIAEIAPDKLVHNMRMQTDSKGMRGVRYSSDGGATWSELEHDAILTCPRCQGSVIRDYTGKGRLFFSNPTALPRRRQQLAIRASGDGGKTWPFQKMVFEGDVAYSDLVNIDQNTVGILFEAWQKKKSGIAFRVYPKKDLLLKDDSVGREAPPLSKLQGQQDKTKGK